MSDLVHDVLGGLVLLAVGLWLLRHELRAFVRRRGGGS